LTKEKESKAIKKRTKNEDAMNDVEIRASAIRKKKKEREVRKENEKVVLKRENCEEEIEWDSFGVFVTLV
jgi:hypothetical protein